MNLKPRKPLKVFITVDTEIWPESRDWRNSGLEEDLQRDFWGVTPNGSFGVGYQLQVLHHYDLKAVFFVESLCASAAGLEPLRTMARTIREGGQEVQLHVHTEWLSHLEDSFLPGRAGQHLRHFNLEEQACILAKGMDNLQACGVDNVAAFRAGNYGANDDTLHALSQQGIRYDTSYNYCYLDDACKINAQDVLLQPCRLHGIVEYPISFFCDYRNHHRHAQLCACSGLEMRHALLKAWESGYPTFVIVSHGFELIKRWKRPVEMSPIVVQRFESLCRFLSQNRDKFATAFFSDEAADDARLLQPVPLSPLQSRLRYTVGRHAEQLRIRYFE